MLLKYYGLYDSVAGNMVNLFTSQNDEVCTRSIEHMIKDPKTDLSLIQDCILKYLFTVDSETGDIVDVQKRDIAVVSTLMAKCSKELNPESYQEIVQRFSLIEEKFETYKELDSKCLKILDVFAKKNDEQIKKFDDSMNKAMNLYNSKLDDLGKTIEDIIGGKIKCQKYKKLRK